MKKINLSRLHVIIRNEISDSRELLTNLQAEEMVRATKIFEATTEEDLINFKNDCRKQKEKYYARVAELEKHERYIEYLKTILDEANRKNGIPLLLLKDGCLQRKLQRLGIMKDISRPPMNTPNAQRIKTADYYKSAFTGDQKIYDLEVTLLDESDYKTATREYEAVLQESRKIQDETAAINQAKFVTIKEFDEFE